MTFSVLPSLFYDFLSARRAVLYAATLGIIGLSIFVLKDVEVQEDIRSMLPDSPPQVTTDLELLQHAPMTRKVIVNLKRRPGTDPMALTKAVEDLKRVMTPPLFKRVVSGPADLTQRAFFSLLFDRLPNLSTEEDLNAIGAGLTREKVQTRLYDMYMQLLSPAGWGIETLNQIDPLGLRQTVMDKLRFLRIIPKMRLAGGHFLSEDGMNALLIADTDVNITDSVGAENLLNRFQNHVDTVIPSSIDVTLISGHRYTAANAAIIKKDLFIVLGFSFTAIFAIFLVFLRDWRATFVFLVPVSVLCIALAMISLAYDRVFAVTVGFGSVLLGISVDFALHVYFALCSRSRHPSRIMAEVSYPILFGGMTTLGAFGSLLFSNLPGQRQIACFAVIGIGASLIISLIILPQILSPPARFDNRPDLGRTAFKSSPRWVVAVWLALLALCVWQGTKLKFNGDLRSVNAVTADIRAAEDHLRETWGDLRGMAMIFAEGKDLQTALEVNEQLFSYLHNEAKIAPILSVAPILPSLKTQLANQEGWRDYWTGEAGTATRLMLENEGRQLGFTPQAFKAYFETFTAGRPPLTPEDLRAVGLGDLLESMVIKMDQKVLILTLVPDTPKVVGLVTDGGTRPAGTRMVSQTRFGRMISQAILDDFVRFISGASLVVLILLSVLLHKPKKVFFALIPVITGLACMCGTMGCLGIGFNLFNIVATILVIGLGVDYGIFMVCRISDGSSHQTEWAILISGLTTLAGFGGLTLARHPALYSIGLTVLLGIGAAIPAALLVIPAVYRKDLAPPR